MKSILNKLLVISIACSFLVACKKDETKTYMKTGVAPVISLSPASIALTSATASDSLETISWTRSDYGFSAVVTYIIQIAKAGTNFASSQQINTGSNAKLKLTGNYLNSLAISAGIAAGTTGQLDIRIKSSLNDSLTILSDKVALTVTTYQTAYPALLVQGGNGWITPATRANGYLLASSGYDSKYEGYLNLPNADGYGGDAFKLVSSTTGKVYGWASNPDTINGVAHVKIVENSGNIWLTPSPRYIKVNADINTLDINYVAVKFYISGDDNAWSTSATPMTFNPATNKWVATNVTLTAGKKIVFTCNGGYDISYKVDANNKLVFAGGPNWAGTNITVPATGTFTVTLDLSAGDGMYTYSIN